MTSNKGRAAAKPNDLIVVSGHRVGDPERVGEILEVLGGPEHPHYRVRWEDEHVSLFYPAGDATIRRAGAKGGRT